MKTTEPAQEATFEIVPAELGLDITAKNSLEVAFQGFFGTAKQLQAKADAITNPKDARTARLEMKSLRIAVEKKHKEMKVDSLLFGRAVDGAKNIFLAIATPIERQLDDIEKAEERRIAKEIELLREARAEILGQLGHVSHGINLGAMTEENWTEYLQQARDLYEVRQARAKREAEEAAAELKRQEEEREAQRLENIRLKDEAEKREAELKAEREAAAAAAEAARKEREAIEAKAKAEREAAEEAARKERLRLQAIAETERAKAQAAAEAAAAAQAKAEADAKALRDAEAKRVADEKAAAEAKAKADAAAAKKAAAAPDKEQLMRFASLIRAIDLPTMKSEDGKAVAADINAKTQGFAKWIEAQAATL